MASSFLKGLVTDYGKLGYQLWHRPLKMASLVYEREIGGGEPGFFQRDSRTFLIIDMKRKGTLTIWIRVQTWLTFETSITQDLSVVTKRQLTTECRAQFVFHKFLFLSRNSVILKSYSRILRTKSDGVVQHGGHTPNRGLTETCSLVYRVLL